ncbi:SDR family NAD(P)-dependent oxidoreductase [Actinomadura algeriensis]|uniref:NAD(P)-dependent dehydrogenase (Short-subunit alcohol dehydrogenase family) n=1 Tax=Actinomadura algeriensis TaxID=1679523 RepID=A0ABR9JM72_9ACTN|nr:SDR family NAD(P)-dependent oxidoreductase [Actinomadura algeriensis]MBE1531225.1 NAD(P)-dependent dehydrogenase (short-subunit alcohol dehydrogenase family) [Actinomadura algeriensis]
MALALVTGAGGAYGTAIARRLAADGHRVAVNDLPDVDLRGLAADLGGIAAPGDVSRPDGVHAMLGRVERAAGERVGVLVAAAAHRTTAPLPEHDPDDWWHVVDTALGGAFACAQAVLPGMAERGGGRIVLLASEAGMAGRAGATARSAAHAGVIALAKSLGREMAPFGIAVNAVAPAEPGASTPLGHAPTAGEVAASVAFLADPRLPTMVGQTLNLTGGRTRARA